MKYLFALVLSFSVVATADALRVDPRQMTNTGEFVPSNCAVWNDGCNDCEKTDSGYVCPPKNCATMRMGYCRVFKDEPEVETEASVTESVVTIGPEKVECDGFIGSCFVVDGELLNYLIYNFDYEPGFEYEVLLRREKLQFSPGEPLLVDAEDIRHEVVRVLSKKPVNAWPADCERWFDGCNTCFYGENGNSSCTMMACTTYDEPRCLDETVTEPARPEPPELTTPNRFYAAKGCASWFDGCNSCGVDENGVIQACTERACDRDQLKEPYCERFRDNKETSNTEILEVQIEPEMVQCNAFRRTCLVMNGKPFDGWIDGFEFEPGYLYELRIEKKLRETPLLDVGPYQYTLLETLTKQLVTPQVAPILPPINPADDQETTATPPSPTMTDQIILEFNIAPQKVDCVGVGPMECLVVNGEYFYDSIAGFEFEPGYEYELKVERTERFANGRVPADANRFQYELVEIVSKNLVDGRLEAPSTSLIPNNCKTWFDGCNTCGVTDGELTYCTEMACMDLKEPYCMSFSQLNDETGAKSLDQNSDQARLYPLVEPYHPNFWGFLKYHLFGWMK